MKLNPEPAQESARVPRAKRFFKRLWFHAVSVVLAVCGITQAALASVTLETVATADTFVRENAPDGIYGARGALSVAGSAACNGSGELVGLSDTFLRFNLASTVASLDAKFGSQNWTISDLGLKVVEFTTPHNDLFGRGQGEFEIRWISADDWSETTLTWGAKGDYLDSDTDISVGTFTNLYQGDQYSPIQRFSLTPAHEFVTDVLAGGDVSLYLTAAESSIGFTLNSKDITGARPKPYLEIVAIPEPTTWLLVVGRLAELKLLVRKRRLHHA